MANKKTQKDLFEELKAYVEGNAELTEFLNKKIEQVSRKRETGKLTATQEANIKIKDVICETLANAETENGLTISEMQEVNETLANLSNQKISALLTQLTKEGKVERNTIKRKAYFSMV